MRTKDMILDEARKVFLTRRHPVLTGCRYDTTRPFRRELDEEPFGFMYKEKNYEVHHRGFTRGKIKNTHVKVDVLHILEIWPNGRAIVYAKRVQVFPCE